MKMTLAAALMTAQNLAPLAQKKLPHRLAYAIGKNLLALQAEQKLVEERRMEMVKTYAESDEAGDPVIKDNNYVFPEEGLKQFKEEFDDFMKTETEVAVYTIQEELLEQLESERYDVLTPVELISLEFMIEKAESEGRKDV